MSALVLLFVVVLIATAWFSFTLGRATADRGTNLNHHRMMMLLMDLRGKDDIVPSMSADSRAKLDLLLAEYEHLDLDETDA